MLDPIIAGDGHAYFAYTYQNETTVSQTTREDCGVSTTITATDTVLHFMVMRVGVDGSSSQTDVHDWESRSLDVENNQAHTYSNIGAIPSLYVQMITNADQGMVFGWEADTPDYCASGKENPRKSCYADVPAASTYGFGSNTTPSAVWPVLQAQDGTFYGGDNNGNLIKFNQSGGVFWSVPNDSPQIATADGGVIGYSGKTYDSQGRATGQIANLPTQSWVGNAYTQPQGTAAQVSAVPQDYASSFAALPAGNQSGNGTAIKESPYPRLKGCVKPNGSTTCPYDYLLVALQALLLKVDGNCPDCVRYVFSKLRSGTDQSQFSKFISRYPPLFFDGTRSTLKLTGTCEPVGPSVNSDASYGCYSGAVVLYGQYATVGDFFASNPGLEALAVYQSANAQNPAGHDGLKIFYRPSEICTASISPDSACQVENESILFHESLHEYYGFGDAAIQRAFGITVNPKCTANISDYISFTIFNLSSNSCGN